MRILPDLMYGLLGCFICYGRLDLLTEAVKLSVLA